MIEGIEHIGIAVRSIAEARGLYEALGLKVEAIEEVPQEGVMVALIPCVSRQARPRIAPSLPGDRRREVG